MYVFVQINPVLLLYTERQRGEYMENKNRRKMFLYNFLKLRNVREAGIRSGYPEDEAFSEGMRMILAESFSKKLSILARKASNPEGLIRAGLERLAFGDINDVVKLVFAENCMSKKEISALDLFNVSEIKRVKGTGVEVKLFDRQKALEKLWEIDNTADVNSSAESFFNAIKAGADAITNKGLGE